MSVELSRDGRPSFHETALLRGGKTVKKGWGEWVYRCGHCGLGLNRDENAARNILYKALQ